MLRNNVPTLLCTKLGLSICNGYTTTKNLLEKKSSMAIIDQYFMAYPESNNALNMFQVECTNNISGNLKSNVISKVILNKFLKYMIISIEAWLSMVC